MKIESTGFTWTHLAAFANEFADHERVVLAKRLERDSARLGELAARMGESHERDGWNAREILAHIAVFSKFYGMLTYKVGSGQLSEIDLLANVRQRDAAAEELDAMPSGELVRSIRDGHQRTVAYLRSADAVAMKRRVAIGGGAGLSADEIARFFLCAHLEQHLDQLERVLTE